MRNVPALTEEEKEKAINAEMKRLKRVYKDIDLKHKSVIAGLVERAAFMRVSLDELEEDINKNGMTELFSQGQQTPYKRKRPEADLYCSLNTGYQKIIKLLADQLPKQVSSSDNDDGFDSFVGGRDD